MSTKEMVKKSAGKVMPLTVKAPTIMEPSGDVPGSITIEPPDGMDMVKPNSAAHAAAPTEALLHKARGGK